LAMYCFKVLYGISRAPLAPHAAASDVETRRATNINVRVGVMSGVEGGEKSEPCRFSVARLPCVNERKLC
jgi:hypothetical protein